MRYVVKVPADEYETVPGAGTHRVASSICYLIDAPNKNEAKWGAVKLGWEHKDDWVYDHQSDKTHPHSGMIVYECPEEDPKKWGIYYKNMEEE